MLEQECNLFEIIKYEYINKVRLFSAEFAAPLILLLHNIYMMKK